MDHLGDLLTPVRRSDAVAVRVPGEPTVEYSYHDLITTAWKTANFFRHRGVHEGASVAIVDDHAVPAVLALFGAAQLGATTRFVPLSGGEKPTEVDARLLVGPGEAVLDFDLPPGATRIAYTADSAGVDDPTVEAFGRSIWSENPTRPPEEVDPDGPVLAYNGETASQRELLRDAADTATALDSDDEVVIRASLTEYIAVVDGILAPLIAGATIALVGPGGSSSGCDPALVVE